jgi:hypothetical protein
MPPFHRSILVLPSHETFLISYGYKTVILKSTEKTLLLAQIWTWLLFTIGSTVILTVCSRSSYWPSEAINCSSLFSYWCLCHVPAYFPSILKCFLGGWGLSFFCRMVVLCGQSPGEVSGVRHPVHPRQPGRHQPGGRALPDRPRGITKVKNKTEIFDEMVLYFSLHSQRTG